MNVHKWITCINIITRSMPSHLSIHTKYVSVYMKSFHVEYCWNKKRHSKPQNICIVFQIILRAYENQHLSTHIQCIAMATLSNWAHRLFSMFIDSSEHLNHDLIDEFNVRWKFVKQIIELESLETDALRPGETSVFLFSNFKRLFELFSVACMKVEKDMCCKVRVQSVPCAILLLR
jgi:hypothetical protein